MQRPAPPAFQMKSTTAVIATLAIVTMSLVAVRAQQAPAPAARPMVPVAASSVAAYPDTYLGENVSVMAAVEALLSKTAFTDQTGQDEEHRQGRAGVGADADRRRACRIRT